MRTLVFPQTNILTTIITDIPTRNYCLVTARYGKHFDRDLQPMQ